MTVTALARPEIAALEPYVTARQAPACVRLNANEAPFSPWQQYAADGLNRYPDIRPARLERRLAELYRVAPDKLLVTRGSSEAIDVLIRSFCRAYRDRILVTSPAFSMYRVYADIQGASVTDVPLSPERDFAFEADAVLERCHDDTKLIFVCSPNNPTGALASRHQLLRLARARRGRSLLVVDEAYVEFGGAASLVRDVARHDNLVVLRTLSKAYALAGARCGALIAPREAVRLLAGVLPPYSFSTPAAEAVLAAITPDNVARAARQIAATAAERERLRDGLEALGCVRRVWPSHANFLLVHFADRDAARRRVAAARILIRELSGVAALKDCARITVGSREQNERLLAALDAH